MNTVSNFMNLNNLMRCSAVLATIFGLQILIVPTDALALYDLKLNAGGEQMARMYASLLIGLALINWLAAKADNDYAKRAIVIGDCLADILCTIVIAMAINSGTVNVFGWLDAGISLLFAVGFGYYGFIARIWDMRTQGNSV
jgi:hypothetical protein